MMRFLEDIWSVKRSEQLEGVVLETLYDDIADSNWCQKNFFLYSGVTRLETKRLALGTRFAEEGSRAREIVCNW